MKSVRWAALGLVITALLAGCKGFWDAPVSKPTNPTTPTTLSSGVFYVLDQTTMQIAADVISSGTLDNVTGSPYKLPATPYSIAIDPNGAFLYVGTANGIFLYSIGSGGTLTLANNNNPISDDVPAAMIIDGPWLIDAFAPATTHIPTIGAIPIDSSNGLYNGSGGAPPSQTFTSITNASLNGMVLSPDGTNLIVALGTAGSAVVPFATGDANPIASTATLIPLVNSGGSALSVAVDPTSRIFYIGETNINSTGGLRVFNYSSLGTAIPRTTPSEITGSPIASGGLSPQRHPALFQRRIRLRRQRNRQHKFRGNIAWFPITASGTTYYHRSGKHHRLGHSARRPRRR